MLRSFTLLLMLFSIVACSHPPLTPVPDAGNPSRCAYTLSGAVTESGSCSVGAVHLANSGPSITTFGFGAGNNFDFSAELAVTTLSLGEFSPAAQVNTSSGLYKSDDNQHVWEQILNQAGRDDEGTFLIHVTATGELVTIPEGTSFSIPEGTLDVTLVPQAGTLASGQLILHATF